MAERSRVGNPSLRSVCGLPPPEIDKPQPKPHTQPIARTNSLVRSKMHPFVINSGQSYADRKALHAAGVHRGLMRGIAPEGESIVLSGGYVDDEDDGDLVVYTGEGGRNPNTGRQVADQALGGGNKWLAHNCVEGIPVRVTRGYKLDSSYAPKVGYRYDGLYQIVSFWSEKGRDGFLVYRFRLERLAGQPPVGDQQPHSPAAPLLGVGLGTTSPQRVLTTSSRVVRSTAVGNTIKEHYDHACQICEVRLVTPAGPYAEGCHVRPLGKPHNGSDTADNVICLCPNCHILFDTHSITIDAALNMFPLNKPMTFRSGHSIHPDNVRYRVSISGYHRKS
jgi:putative restriction endonuclease